MSRPIQARIDLAAPPSSFPLPVYARLQDASGQPYLLVKASPPDLAASGHPYQVLDDDAAGRGHRPRRCKSER